MIVTGFDNISRVGADMPGLTTIQPDYDEMVVQAMNHLDRQIRGGWKNQGQTKIAIPGKFILGESCGCGRRDPDYFRQVSAYALGQVEMADGRDALMNNMSIVLGACDDINELHGILIDQRFFSPIVRDHYLCLFGEPNALMQEASDMVCLVHATRDHGDCGMPMTTFERSRLLPPMAERLDEPQMFFVKLLHQKGHNFGYSLFQYDPGEVPSRNYVQINVLISIALENIHRREELMRLYEDRRLSSITDMLTGLLNRRGLMERVQPQWHEMVGRRIAFLCVDMDHLKRINDTYGHAAGDHAIRMVGRAIHETLPPGAAGARIGGDEFVIFLPLAGSVESSAFEVAFERELHKLNKEEDKPFTVTASVGCYVKRLDEADTIEGCIQASDQEMYRIKAARHSARTT